MFENQTASAEDESHAGPTLPVLTATARFVRGSVGNPESPCVCPPQTRPPAAVMPDPPPLAPGSAIRRATRFVRGLTRITDRPPYETTHTAPALATTSSSSPPTRTRAVILPAIGSTR